MEIKGFKLKFKAEGKVLERERDEAKRDAEPEDATPPAAGGEPSSDKGE